MNDEPQAMADEDSNEQSWRPLTRLQRRVAGVLVEKSKTTPGSYPMTLNAIRTACNQKSNRSPQMDLREDEVEDTLYELREMGAAAEVHSGGRVPKYKHYLYEWLNVEKAELAVLTELLLRGEQSLGDLRARSARMEPISGLNELKPIVQGLLDKGLMIELTAPGRGQIVTHNLYLPEERERLENQYDGHVTPQTPVESPASATTTANAIPDASRLEAMETRITTLEQQLAEVQTRLDQLMN